MPQRWKQRPPGSTWGDFGTDDQLGRVNLLTPQNTLKAIKEVKEGLRFCLSLPLDIPGSSALNARRRPPEFKPVIRGGHVAFNLPLCKIDSWRTEVNCDEAVTLYMQHSTQWDSFAHMGVLFDADVDGEPEPVYYNGYRVVSPDAGKPRFGSVGAYKLGIEHMARACMQGRGVMVDLHAHFGDAHRAIGYDELVRVLERDGVEIEQGDLLCLHTGYAQRLLEDPEVSDAAALNERYTGLNGRDERLKQWITDSGVVALIADNRAVEFEHQDPPPGVERGPLLGLHELCLFKLGVHLGELWYLTELAHWLRERGRHYFLLTAPPLHLPGAVGSPANAIATV
jgi:hypothetical protein